MENPICATCFKPKALLSCGICTESICKYCAQFLEDDSFAFLSRKSQDLEHTTYCRPCFDAKVAPALESYQHTLDQAKEILIFSKVQNKETRFIKRYEDRVHVSDCADHDEVIMRLAFQAAHGEFNGVIDIEVGSQKIRTGAFQTTKWHGSGIPAHINPDKLVKDRSFWSTPN